jgi:membrane-associated phospholipid phosphatase
VLRRAAIFAGVLLAVWQVHSYGIPLDREGVLAWLVVGLAAAGVGRRAVVPVVTGFLPFALVLIGYDYLRGLSAGLGMATWWQPQIAVDKFLSFGTEPTVWLQAHLKYGTSTSPDPHWWDVLNTLCYNSFFLLPYVLAAVLWLRNRAEFHRWALRFVALSFVGFALFTLMPAARPWAAARCTADQIASHPSDPICMNHDLHTGGLFGPIANVRPGADPWVQRISDRGWGDLHVSAAQPLIDKGRHVVDPVAAFPSLHLAGTVLFVIFIWARVNRWWRPLLVAYPLVMTFSLVYSGEHYLIDCIAGAITAALVSLAADRIERARASKRATRMPPGAGAKDSDGPCVDVVEPCSPEGRRAGTRQ